MFSYSQFEFLSLRTFDSTVADPVVVFIYAWPCEIAYCLGKVGGSVLTVEH